MKSKQIAVIIGAGPAGLTAAYELLKRKTSITPIVLEQSRDIGGISKTVNYKGNRIDIGGHRFFSKSDTVMDWWLDHFPIESKKINPKKTNKVMLVRSRTSRIYYKNHFFDYPLKLNIETLKKLGLFKSVKIFISYLLRTVFPKNPEKNLEDFYQNRFGDELYNTFFREYTQKLWGLKASQLSKEWGNQRIKKLSIIKTLTNAILPKAKQDFRQKDTETSLINTFLYPKFGPGQMWKEIARKVKKMGGQVLMQSKAIKINQYRNKIKSVEYTDKNGKTKIIKADYVFSTMTVPHLIEALDANIPKDIEKIVKGLPFRHFITIGLLLDKKKLRPEILDTEDNWIYIQEPGVKMLRMQIFNNWSPYLVKDSKKHLWVGLEYTTDDSEKLWNMNKKELVDIGISDMEKIGFIDKENTVLDSTIIKHPYTYPTYAKTYKKMPLVRSYLNKFKNLFLIGRNGMHRYNNQDHSMLSSIAAVENIINGVATKDNIWNVNTEQEYHEVKAK